MLRVTGLRSGGGRVCIHTFWLWVGEFEQDELLRGNKPNQLCSPELPNASCQPSLALVQLAALRSSLPPPCLPLPHPVLSSALKRYRAMIRGLHPVWVKNPLRGVTGVCPNSSPTRLVGWRPHPSVDISLVVHVTALQSAQFYKCAGEMKGAGNSDCRASSEELLTSSSQGRRGRGRGSEGGVQEGGEER